MLVYLLCLMLPVSALAEPLPWLRPFIDRMANASSDTVMTFQADGEGFLAMANDIIDSYRQQYASLADTYELYSYMDEDEAADYLASIERQLNLQRTAWKAYAPAIAALLNETAVTITSATGSALYDVSIGGQHWFSLGIIDREDGTALLTSDLFPSYALTLEESNAVSLSDSFNLDSTAVQAILSRLPELEDYNILHSLYDAYEKGLTSLEADGLAQREGDELVYSVSNTWEGDSLLPINDMDAMRQRFPQDTLNLDERTLWLFGLFDQTAAEEEAQEDLEAEEVTEPPILTDFSTELEQIEALRYYRGLGWTVNQSVQRRYAMTENEITYETDETYSSHYHFDQTLGDAETMKILTEEYPWILEDYDNSIITGRAFRLTPDTLEYHKIGDYSEAVLAIDATEENEILLTATSVIVYMNEEQEETSSLRLTRDEEGQEWILTTDGMYNLAASIGSPIISMRFDNGVNFIESALRFSGMEKPLAVMRGDVHYAEEARPTPNADSLTVVSVENQEAIKALAAELRKVGVTKLNTLILTALPSDAAGLRTPLLAITAALSQLGK